LGVEESGQATKADIFWFFFLAAQQKKNRRPRRAWNKRGDWLLKKSPFLISSSIISPIS